MNPSRLWMLTGAQGAGKTTFCRALATLARQKGWKTAGLLSPPGLEDGQKTSILTEDLLTGETRPLAASTPHASFDLPFGRWYFNQDSLNWANQVLENCLPCDLLIIDELGPLELIHRTGWQAARDVLRSKDYRLGLVVVREELRSVFYEQFTVHGSIEIDRSQSVDTWMHTWWSALAMHLPGTTTHPK